MWIMTGESVNIKNKRKYYVSYDMQVNWNIILTLLKYVGISSVSLQTLEYPLEII